jgi:hypothetical protein
VPYIHHSTLSSCKLCTLQISSLNREQVCSVICPWIVCPGTVGTYLILCSSCTSFVSILDPVDPSLAFYDYWEPCSCTQYPHLSLEFHDKQSLALRHFPKITSCDARPIRCRTDNSMQYMQQAVNPLFLFYNFCIYFGSIFGFLWLLGTLLLCPIPSLES